MANASMQALQAHAEKLNQQVAEVNASIKALGDVPDDSPALLEYRKQLRRLNSDLKDVNTTMKDYTRGVKAAGELYRHYAMGNIEDMSIKAIRAGVNGMKKRYDNLKAGGDPGDAEEMRLIEAITNEADVVVKRFKTDYQHVVEEIARGGTVTEQTLKRTRDGLADLMQTAETEAEKNELTNYWQKVGAAIEAVAVENRRLRGEVADREEAMRIAYATDHDGSQQAIHDAEARADAARHENDELRQRLDLKQQQRRELGQEMDINSMQQRALMDQRDELKAQEKENRAIRNQRVDDANKELNAARRAAKTQQQAYDEQKQTVEKLRTEVQGLTDDIRKMGEAKAEPKIDTSGIDAKLEELRGSLSRVQQMKSTAQEKVASAKEVLGDTDKLWNNERVKKALKEDRVTQEENVAKLNAKWDEYWEKQEQNAREFAAVLNKAAIDDVDWDEFYTHVTGPNAEMAKSWYRVQQRNMRGLDYWGEDSDNYKELVSLRASKKLGSASDGMLEELKLLEALKRKWYEYQKALNKAREETPKYDAAYTELDNARTELIQQERLLETYSEHERQLKEQIAETEKLAAAQQQSTTATAAQTEALKQQEQELESLKKDLTDATNDLNRSQGNLSESLKPLEELGLKEADLEDKAKLRAAAEKKVLEIMEAQANVEKEVAEQSRKIISELKPNALGGTKADQEFYAKNKNAYAIDDDIDSVMDRIAHLETVSKMKNGRKFSDNTYWDPDDELDESETIVMTDKEKQNALDELRVLKQHVREVILKAIREVGDVDKAVLEVTGGDGVAEDTKFGEQINDKISDLKDKIQEQITTTLESYEDILDEVDRDEKLSKQEVEHRVNSHIEYLKDNVARDRDDVDYFQGKVSDVNTAIAAKEKEIELTKQQTAAQQQSAQSSEQLAQKQEQLSQKTAELNQQQDKLNGMVDETVTANQRLARAEQEQTDARNAQAEAKKHEGEAVKKVEDELRGLIDEQLKNAQAYSHLTEEINADTAAMQRNITTEQEATREADRLRSGSIDKMEQALARLRESNRKLDPTIDKEEWERGERAIGQLTLRLEELKKQSAELRGEPVLDMMTQRMDQLGTLSRDALTETKKFWEQMVDGAQKGSTELADYEQHLKSIALEEQARVREHGREAFAFFQREDYRRTNAADTEEQRKALVAYRDALPADATDHIEAINALLEKQAQFVKEAAGEWMSLEKAMELAKTAGTDQFAGSAKDIQLATAALERQRDTIIATIREKRNLGQATKAEEDQLADLTKKLRSLKFEQDNVNMSQEKMRTLIETPANAVNLDELRAAIKRADGQLRQMQQSLGENSSEYKRFAEQVRNAKNVMKEMEGQAKASATAWEKAFSRLKTYVVMYMGFNEVWQKITGTMGDMLELSDKMGEVIKTTGFTADQVARLSDNLKDLDTRTTMVKLMELSSIAGSIGLKTQEQVEGFTDAANQLMVALPEMGTEAARTLMKIADATGDLEKNEGNVRETLERVGSTIIALRANSAAAAGPITDFVSRVGAVGAQAGISIDQIAALGATVDALGGRVEMSATALSRMIPAIRNNSFEVANAIGMAEQDLKKMTSMEQMVAIFKALRDSVKQFDTSTDEGMNAMADKVEQMLGNSASMQEVMKTLNQQGARAGIVFGLLSQNVDKLEDQLSLASDAYQKNTALMNEYNNMNETAAAKWERLKNQIEEFFVSADSTSWLSDIIDFLRVLADWVTDEGPLGRLVRYTMVYIGLMKTGWAESIGTAVLAAYEYIFATNQSTAATVENTAATAADTAATVADTAAKEAQAVASEQASAAQGKFNKTMKANLITAVLTAVVALGWAIYDYAKKAKKAASELDALADAEKKAKEESIKERAELERLYKVTQDQTKSMEERKKALHDMVGDKKYKQYYANLSNETELAKAAAGAYKELAAEIVRAAKARVYQEKIEELARKNVALEDKIEEDQQYVDDNAANYNRVKGNVDNSINPAGIFGGTAAAAAAHGDQRRQYLREYEKKQEDIIANQEEIKKNNETIGKMEEKLKDTGVKLGGNGGEGGSGDGSGGGGGGGGGTTPYGQYDRVTDPYSKWNGDDLVARRKEMLVRVRALANGADVQKVLSEDAKFISEAVRKNIKTTDQAIEWYNAERLKIQEALYNKHLTPTGDWLDPKKGAGNWRKQLQTDFDNYLRILDAYYTERKAHIEKAQAEEGLSEAEAQRLTVENETVWRKHRMELQQIYLGKSADIAKDERQRIYNILAEQDEDSADMVEKQIAISIGKLRLLAQKSEVEARKIDTKLVKDIATDHYKQQNAVSKQMEAIEKIISEERPFDGITKNLRDNLSTMGVLFADFNKKRREAIERGEQPEDDMAERAKQTAKRLSVVLDGVPDAYRMTFDQLKEVMIKEGFGEWAKAIEGDEQLKLAMMAQIRKTYDQVQEAIRKEAALIKKHADNLWNDALTPDGKSMKNQFEAVISQLGLQADQVKRANSLIGAGVASDRVADRLVTQQMKVQLAMERARFALMHKIGEERIRQEQAVEESLRRQGKLEEAKRKHADIENMQKSLGLAISEEQKKVDEQRVAIQNQLEESQNRLYTSLREWADLLTSSLQGVMEASHAGDAEYYNELAKLNLTGKGGPGAGTYVVIDDAGTSDATAHYEYLDERQALERQHEIEVQNAQAEAWKKLWDDINMKMSEQITDWMNAYLQNKATEDNTAELQKLQVKIDDEVGRIDGEIDATKANTDAIIANTEAILASRSDMGGTGIDSSTVNGHGSDMGVGSDGVPNALRAPAEGESGASAGTGGTAYTAPWQQQTQGDGWAAPMLPTPESDVEAYTAPWAAYAEMSEKTTRTVLENNKKQASSTSSMFAKMTQAANLYGVAYQAMSNDNLDTAQKFEMIALQAVGNAAIAGLNVALSEMGAKTAVNTAETASKDTAEHGSILGPILTALSTAVLGGLMGLATSKIAKSKSTIASITGANSGAGRLATGMLTYAGGNVNELTDPASLTPGRQYNVDGADGKTYRARYMGKGAKTHITNGPEFHLVGEAGREAIIDAKTTRLLQMNETGIWRDIQTLYNGGAISGLSTRRRRGGVRAFAEGNIGEFEEMGGDAIATNGTGGANTEQMIASLDRNSAIQEALLERLNQPIYAQNILYGPDGLPNVIAKLQKEAQRHGEKYL